MCDETMSFMMAIFKLIRILSYEKAAVFGGWFSGGTRVKSELIND